MTTPDVENIEDQHHVKHDVDPTTGSIGPRNRQRIRTVLEWIVVIVGALIVALLIKTFLFQAFYIPSESMEPTLVNRDRVVVNKLSYRLHDVNRGDLVVFDRPPNEPVTDIEELIKRVIGLPGETVEARDGSIYIDGQGLNEPYLNSETFTQAFGPITVPADHVFVMGDNRGNSRDSRVFGPIDQDLIVGRAFVLVWPLGRLGFL
ncbi:MAG: signal peptidase I [Acidimicrobiales bacterium]|nr:signal peptidase I [Acidimicrobiales bacterium]